MNPLRFVRTIEHRPFRTAISQSPVHSVLPMATRPADAAAFAHQILDHYNNGLNLAERIDLIWRRMRLQNVQQTNVTIPPSYPRPAFQLRLAPVIHLQHSTVTHLAQVVQHVLPVYQDVAPTSGVDDVQPDREPVSPVMRLPMIQRLLEREVRIDSTEMHTERRVVQRIVDEPPTNQSPEFSSRRTDITQPVGDVARRSLNVRALDSGDQTEQPATDPVMRMERFDVDSPVRALRKPTTPVIDQADLNTLTDRVVQAIDRRLVAQRERLGRL